MTAQTSLSSQAQVVQVDWREYRHAIEYVWVGSSDPAAPIVVFLHEGLGSMALWKDFPQQLSQALGFRGLVFSRWGYGNSSARAPEVRWPPDFMHQQAHDFLPAFFTALDLNPSQRPLWLFGHSDGGSIALLYAAAFPQCVAGAVVAAPHIFVEDVTVRSIEQARETYLNTDLPSKLKRYHANPDSAFWGWNHIWLDPAFRSWNLEPLLPAIRCPLLAVQGYNDEYGTMAQIDGIAEHVKQTRLLKLHDCGHSPHRDQPDALIQAVVEFVSNVRTPAG